MPLGCNSNCCPPPANYCPDRFGCPPAGFCPDFEIRRFDTTPPIILSVQDCNGPIDLTDTVAEVSMWALGRLKRPLALTDTYFALADNIGFEQIYTGDIVVMDRVRAPEQMLVTGFDETNKLVQVQRGYNGTLVGNYERGCRLRIFRILNAVAETDMVTEDIPQVDGTVEANVLQDSQLSYNWAAQDTCLPGCFWLEFKLLKMASSSLWFLQQDIVTPSFASYTPAQTGCDMPAGAEWVRRFPVASPGYLVHIVDTPTANNVM